AVDWDTTRVLAGKIGDYVVVARRERNGPSWYIGAITDEEGRTFDVPLTFLTPGRKYVAEIYADGPGANWLTNPLPVSISKRPPAAGAVPSRSCSSGWLPSAPVSRSSIGCPTTPRSAFSTTCTTTTAAAWPSATSTTTAGPTSTSLRTSAPTGSI